MSTSHPVQRVRLPLGFLAVVSIGNLITASNLKRDGSIEPTTFLILVGIALSTGLIVALGALEELFGRSVADFKSSTLALAALLAVLAYAGRAQSITDVNAIFHVDAGALPMTTAAGTAMHVARLLFWPVGAD